MARYTLEFADPEVVCVQASLNHYNTADGWLPKCASMEYAMWFDALLRGLGRLQLPVPLGGTSLYFRTKVLRDLGGWDPDNVTEDADLGVRLARAGYRAEVFDSTTHEEAPVELVAWIKQRTRWIKGFMLTWIVHMRSPRSLVDDLGWRGTISINLMLLDGFVAFLAQPFFLIGIAYWLAFGSAPWASSVSATLINASTAVFVLGHLLIVAAAFRSVRARFGIKRALWTPTLWIYWQFGGIAAWRALWQVFTSPQKWEKTAHGISASAKARRGDALGQH